MFLKLIKFLPTEEIVKIVPDLIVNLLGDLLDKQVTQEVQNDAKRYLKIADYANEALDLIIEILNCIIDKKEINPDALAKLQRWAKGESKV